MRLVKGKTVDIDATTLDANAAQRSIVRRDARELPGLPVEAGAGLGHRDAHAPGSIRSGGRRARTIWTHSHDPDARITKMKDGADAPGPQGQACRRSGDGTDC